MNSGASPGSSGAGARGWDDSGGGCRAGSVDPNAEGRAGGGYRTPPVLILPALLHQPPQPGPGSALAAKWLPRFPSRKRIIKYLQSLLLFLPSSKPRSQPRKTQPERKVRSFKDSPILPPLPSSNRCHPHPSAPPPSSPPAPPQPPSPQETGGTWQAISSPINLWCNN